MRKDTELKLLALGLDTTLVAKIETKKQTLSSLRGQSREALQISGFTEDEADLIVSKLNRTPVDSFVLNNLLNRCGECCCFCKDGNSSRPFQIHHIVEYHISQDNSEQNLLCVCPNHHVLIHRHKYSVDYQIEQKTGWQSVWEIAQNYRKASIPFSFGSFEPITFTSPSEITDVFQLGTPSNATCRELTSGPLADKIEQQLKIYNRAVLFGNSGSGKSTLAKGVAARFTTNFKVFEYLPSLGPSNQHNQLITTFLSEAGTPIILIIDDANGLLSGKQIENILRVSTVNAKLLITYTKNTFDTDGDLEQHLLYDRIIVNWETLRPSIITKLLQHEKIVVNHLKKHWTNRTNMHDLGMSFLTTSLSQLLNKYAYSVNSVWQFIFLVGGGLNQVKEEFDESKNNQRFDVVVLKISITQIADFEKGVSVQEIRDLLTKHLYFSSRDPGADWIIEQLNALIKKRIIKKDTGFYKTIHRELAKEFIETAYIDPVAKDDVIALFDEIFSDYRTNVRRIFVLSSWFRGTEVSHYISSWAKKLTLIDWNGIVSAAAADELQTLYILCEDLSLKFRNNVAIHAAFSGNELAITQAILRNRQHTLRYMRSVFTLLKHHAKEVLQNILIHLQPTDLAYKIKTAAIYEIDDVQWLLGSVDEVSSTWVPGLRGTLSFDDLKSLLEKVDHGRVDQIHDVFILHRIFINELTRSQYNHYTDQIARCLKDCGLSEIAFPNFGFSELSLFRKDIDKIIDSIDIGKIASDFEVATPRHWGSILQLCTVLQRWDNFNGRISEIFDRVNMDRLIGNIENHYETATYELRLLIYQFKFANSDRQELFGELVSPFVERILQRHLAENDHNDLLKALYSISKPAAIHVATTLNKPLPEDKEFMEVPELQAKIDEAERAGEDYVLETYFT